MTLRSLWLNFWSSSPSLEFLPRFCWRRFLKSKEERCEFNAPTTCDNWEYSPIAESEVVAPSDMMAIGDSFDASILFMRRNLADLEGFGNTLARHQGKANVVFCDGHVES